MAPSNLASGFRVAIALVAWATSADAATDLILLDDPVQSSKNISVQCAVDVADALLYPTNAVTARIMGVVSASVNFDEQGAIGSIDVSGHPILASDVVKTLRSASRSERCAGQKIAMRFSFVLDQNLDVITPVAVRSVFAFHYEIVAPAPTIEITIADPPWIFTRRGRLIHDLKTAWAKLR